MRFLQQRQVLVVFLYLASCTTDDTGKPCGATNTTSVPQEPIVGENPSVEVVRLSRDAACETFQCLTNLGIAPYCTRKCTYKDPPSKAKACTSDSDCTSPQHCNNQICNDDDCPAGFWCRTVQDVGPNQGQQYCVRRDRCKTPFDCDDVGRYTCTPMGCYDVCLQNDASCAFHELVCAPASSLGCKCADDSTTCGDAGLVCKPPNAAQTWPAGSVKQVGICLPKS